MGSLSANKLNTYGPCGSHPEATLVLAPQQPPHTKQHPAELGQARGKTGQDGSEGTQSGHQADPSTAEEPRPHALNKKVTHSACYSQIAAGGGIAGLSRIFSPLCTRPQNKSEESRSKPMKVSE